MSSFYRNKYRSIEIVTGPSLLPTIGWAALAVLAQTTFAPYLMYRGAVPSFVTIAIVLYAIRAGARRGAVLGIIAGALEDVFAGTGGAWTVASTIVALGVGAVARGFFSDGFPMLGALVAITVLARDTVFWLVMRLEGYPPGLATAHAHTAIVQAALTGFITVLYLIGRSRLVVDRTNVERYP
ncbi:MAG: rod shape-determining protein MreD [Candidatus Velthaea sp.]